MKTITYKVSLIDLAPTICELAGVEPSPSWKGQSLFKPKNIIYHQTAWRKKDKSFTSITALNQCKIACQTDNWKYIKDYGKNKEELYDLKNDPEEQINLVEKETNILSNMREAIKKFERENPPLSLIEV